MLYFDPLRPRLLVLVLSLALCAVIAATGCGGDEDDASSGRTTPGPATAQARSAPTATPALRSERRWAFLGQRGIRAAFPPADLQLYRSLLPAQFDMPDQPLVVATVVHYYDVTAPLVPYREGYVLLRCKYQGRTGFYTLTMPVDDETANAGGRDIGFNKYVAEEIKLEESGGEWKGRVIRDGITALEIAFTATGEPVTTVGRGETTFLFNLLPPGEGPTVNEVSPSPAGDETSVATTGTAVVGADAGEKWAGLLQPGGATVWAQYFELTGDSVLQWTEGD